MNKAASHSSSLIVPAGIGLLVAALIAALTLPYLGGWPMLALSATIVVAVTVGVDLMTRPVVVHPVKVHATRKTTPGAPAKVMPALTQQQEIEARVAELEMRTRPDDDAWVVALRRRVAQVIWGLHHDQPETLDGWTDDVPASPFELGEAGRRFDEARRYRRACALRVAEKTIFNEKIKIARLDVHRRQEERDTKRAVAELAYDIWLASERERLRQRVNDRIDLPADGHPSGIVFGARVEDGTDLVVPVKSMQHMLVGGTTGSGKSVFLQQIVFQLAQSAEVSRILIFDLKGGVEFYRYKDNPRVEIVWEFSSVIRVVNELVALMAARQEDMRREGVTTWPGRRTFVVIDEYAEIQADIDAAYERAEKGVARQLVANLVRIARRARALGLVLICALQKPTLDAMDSALRSNLNCRICLRVNSRQQAVAVLDGLDDAPLDPRALETGRFIYSDLSRGIIEYAQTQIAPGVQLGEDT